MTRYEKDRKALIKSLEDNTSNLKPFRKEPVMKDCTQKLEDDCDCWYCSFSRSQEKQFKEREDYNKALRKIRDLIKEDYSSLRVSLSIDDPTKASYQPPKGARTKTSLNRVVRRLFGVSTDELQDHDLSSFCAQVMSRFIDVDGCSSLVKGKAISKAYKDHFGLDTCMTGGNGHLVSMLKKHPDIVQLLMYERGKRKARALLWTCNDGVRVLDRIYPESGDHVQAIWAWCEKHSIVHRVGTGYAEGRVILSDGKKHEVTMSTGRYYPYMDTFRYTDDDGKGETVTLNNYSGHSTLDSTEGRYPDQPEPCGLCTGNNCRERHWVAGRRLPLCTPCYEKYAFCCWRCGDSRMKTVAVMYNQNLHCQSCIDYMGRMNTPVRSLRRMPVPRAADIYLNQVSDQERELSYVRYDQAPRAAVIQNVEEESPGATEEREEATPEQATRVEGYGGLSVQPPASPPVVQNVRARFIDPIWRVTSDDGGEDS